MSGRKADIVDHSRKDRKPRFAMERRKNSFLDLPGEIRNMIYQYVLVAPLHIAMQRDPDVHVPDPTFSLFLCRNLFLNNVAREVYDPGRCIDQVKYLSFR